MNAFAIASIITAVSYYSMGALVLWKGQEKYYKKSWLLFCFFAGLWGIGSFFASTTMSYEEIHFWWRIAVFGSIMTPVAFYHFIDHFLNLNNKKLLILIYSMGTFFCFINFFIPNLFLGHYRLISDNFCYLDWTINKSYIHVVFYITFYWILLNYTFFLLIKAHKITLNEKINQLKYLTLGTMTGWLGPHLLFITAYGLNNYPYGNFVIPLLPLIIGYAMIKHNLLDINIVIKKSLVYSLSVSLITVLFLILVLIFERLSQNILGYQSIYGSILAAIVIALAFTPLRNKVQEFFDRIFYKGTTDEISQQNELLRQEVAQAEKFKAVATLASGMAHEIKNPLTAIKTFSEYLRIKGEDPEFREKFSELVGKEVDRVDNLVHELLEFARPAPLTLKDVNIHKLLDETLEFLSSKLVKQNIKTEKAFKSDIKLIKADPNQLKQVFLNLFMNAIDAMEKGGTLTISTLNPTPSTLSIRIKDTGCGIPKEDLKHIFDPFFTKKDNGTGLGLAISYGIIKEHHGDIKVKSKPNEGTEFIIELMVSK